MEVVRAKARLAASHFSVMVHKTSQVLIAGPAVVERAMGEKMTKEELGGSAVHLKSGVVDNAADSEGEVIEQIRRFLSYLPRCTAEMPPRVPRGVPSTRSTWDTVFGTL